MKVNSIEWHEHNATNQLIHLANEKVNLELVKQRYERLEKDTDFYLFQIKEAKRIGKNTFDRGKFRVKK